jgi:hypothetical protein
MTWFFALAIAIVLVLVAGGASAGQTGGARMATVGSKFSNAGTFRSNVAPRLTCVGQYCPRTPKERVQTTGTNKANPSPEVRVHGGPNGVPEGGVTVTSNPRPGRLCAGWFCP